MNPLTDADERAKAIDPTHSFVVRAPAGSGKTGLLTQRFLRLLPCVSEPEQVLAVTFTRKAAAEMKTRILAALADADAIATGRQSMPDDPFNRQTLNLAMAALAHANARGWTLEHHPERLKVLTIDSLCSAIVARAPLGAEPAAIHPPTEDARGLYRESVREVLAVGSELEACASALEQVLEVLGNNAALLESLLVQMLGRRDQWQRMQHQMQNPDAFAASVAALVQEHLDEGAELFSFGVRERLFALLAFAGRSLESIGQENVYRELESVSALDPGCLAHARILSHALLTKDGRGFRKRLSKGEGFPAQKDHADPALAAQSKAEMQALLQQFAETRGMLGWLKTVRDLPDPERAGDDWALVQAAGKLLTVAYENLKLVFDLHRKSDFIEIHGCASASLGTEEAPSDFALELDYRLSHILVDEFQDTSVAQYALFKQLVAGWTGDDGRTLFFVGDPMQSIYRFREAEYALFLGMLNDRRFSNVALTALDLSANFRAHPTLVEWLNAHRAAFMPQVDMALMPPPNSPRGRRQALAWKDADAAAKIKPDADPKVQWHLLVGRDRTAEAARVCEVVQAIRVAQPTWKIGILAPYRASLTPVADALTAAGVAFRGVDLQPLSDRQAVTDVMALALALMQPGNRLAWLSVLRAPTVGLALSDLLLVSQAAEQPTQNRPTAIWRTIAEPDAFATLAERGFSEDGLDRLGFAVEALAPVMRNRGRTPLCERLRAALDRLGFYAVLDDDTDRQAVSRFIALVEGSDFNESCCTEAELSTLVEAQMLTPEPEAGTRIELMTVHKSKGLEFDAVLVVGMGHTGGNGEAPLIAWHEFMLGSGTSMLAAGRRAADKSGRALFNLITREEKYESMLERHRLLYVALTRARSQLHMVGCVAEKANGTRAPMSESLLALLWPHCEDEIARDEAAMDVVPIIEAALPTMPADDFGPQVRRPATPTRRVASDWQQARRARLPDESRTSPSAIDVRPEFSWAGWSARVVGTLMHALLEHLGRPGAPPLDDLDIPTRLAIAKSVMRREGLDPATLANAAARIEAALERLAGDAVARWILDPGHSDIHNEWALTLLDSDPQGRPLVRNMVVDRSFVSEGVRWIVDYKTSTHEGGDLEAFLAEEQRRYAPQLERYARAVAALEARPCRVGLYFPFIGAWREWTPEP